GLLPRLSGPWVAEEEVTNGFCRHAIMRPGDQGSALESLAQALSGALPELTSQGTAAQLARAWSHSPEAAVNDVRGALARETQAQAQTHHPGGPAPSRIVLLVDQLEELFTKAGSSLGEKQKFALVLDALARSGISWVLATLRSDFYPALAELPVLKALRNGD